MIVCSPSNVLKHISFSVKSDLKALDHVLSSFEELHQSWIPKKDWLQSKLALAEGFTNAVRHAHKYLPPSTLIDISICLSAQGMEIRIWDCGPSFDLQQFLKALEYKKNQLADHGQGIPILNKIATRLSYLRVEDNRNCLLVIKEFSTLTN